MVLGDGACGKVGRPIPKHDTSRDTDFGQTSLLTVFAKGEFRK